MSDNEKAPCLQKVTVGWVVAQPWPGGRRLYLACSVVRGKVSGWWSTSQPQAIRFSRWRAANAAKEYAASGYPNAKAVRLWRHVVVG